MARLVFLLLCIVICIAAGFNDESQERSLSENVENQPLERMVRSPEAGRKNGRKKKSKKLRKIRKKKQQQGGRKQKKQTRKFKNKKIQKVAGNCARQAGTDDGTCLANIETAMDYEGIQIKNFEKQKNSVKRFTKFMTNKGGKKDDFGNSTSYLNSALGGSCGAGAATTHALLSNCSASIGEGCTVPDRTDADTALEGCLANLTKIKTKNAACYTMLTADSADLSAACTCYKEAADMVAEAKLVKCSAKADFDSVKGLKKDCSDKFMGCKQAEDDSIGLIQVCNGGTTPAPATAAPTTAADTAAPTTAAATAAATTAAPVTMGQTTVAASAAPTSAQS